MPSQSNFPENNYVDSVKINQDCIFSQHQSQLILHLEKEIAHK